MADQATEAIAQSRLLSSPYARGAVSVLSDTPTRQVLPRDTMTYFRTTSLLAALAVAPMAACGTFVSPTSTSALSADAQQMSNDLTLLSTGLAAMQPSLAAVPNMPPKVLADVTKVLADIAAVQGALAANTVPPVSTVQEISAVIGDIATVALPLVPGGAAFIPVVQAAQVLGPVIVAEYQAMAKLPAPKTVAAIDPNAVATARLVLRGAVAPK